MIAHEVVTRRFGGAAGVAPCDTVTVRPAMVTVVLRDEEAADAENAIVAEPVPDAGAVITHVNAARRRKIMRRRAAFRAPFIRQHGL